jgi:hypothetical protein
MKYAVEMGSGAMIYIPSNINIGSGIQKSIGGIHTHRQHSDIMSPEAVFCGTADDKKYEKSFSKMQTENIHAGY